MPAKSKKDKAKLALLVADSITNNVSTITEKKSTAYSFVLSMNDSELFECIFSSRVSERSNNTLPSIASVLPKELEIN